MIAQHLVISASSEFFVAYRRFDGDRHMPLAQDRPHVGATTLKEHDIDAADTERKEI